jgi:hypothetical protein
MRKQLAGWRAFVSVALTVAILFVGASRAYADTIRFSSVTQTVAGRQVSLALTPNLRSDVSLLAVDAPQTPGGTNSGVETVQLGDVSGTICNCGEIRSPAGFPFLALLPLAAIPFFFIHHRTTPPPNFTPTPPTPPTSVPEPTTLLLLGSGLLALGAGARRRKNARAMGES